MDDLDRWLTVTDRDVAIARQLWLDAIEDLAPGSRVAGLYDDLRRLINTQAQQIAEDFRAAHRTVGGTPTGTND